MRVLLPLAPMFPPHPCRWPLACATPDKEVVGEDIDERSWNLPTIKTLSVSSAVHLWVMRGQANQQKDETKVQAQEHDQDAARDAE